MDQICTHILAYHVEPFPLSQRLNPILSNLKAYNQRYAFYFIKRCTTPLFHLNSSTTRHPIQIRKYKIPLLYPNQIGFWHAQCYNLLHIIKGFEPIPYNHRSIIYKKYHIFCQFFIIGGIHKWKNYFSQMKQLSSALKFRCIKKQHNIPFRPLFLLKFYTNELQGECIMHSLHANTYFTLVFKHQYHTYLNAFCFNSQFFLGEYIRPTTLNNRNQVFFKPGQIYQINKSSLLLRKANPILLASNGILHVNNLSLIESNTRLLTMLYTNCKSDDIVQGIPKIEVFFEARKTQTPNILFDNLHTRLNYFYNKYKFQYSYKKAVRKSIIKLQQIIVNEIQYIYSNQGISISDKHIEIIIRQMTSKVRILNGGSTGLLPGEYLDIVWVEKINLTLKARRVKYEPSILGISKSCLETNSFISAASFQETIRVLTKSTVQHKMDFICGLKENIIIGHLIPAGTGFIAF